MKKTSVLFVCLGNICRSPAAEAIFIKLIKEKNQYSNFIVDSAGTGSWHEGKKADSRMRFAAKRRGINIESIARQIKIKDFENFNYILAMDNSNFENLISLQKSSEYKSAKITKLQLYANTFLAEEVPDPYYGGDDGFERVLDILEDSVDGFLKKIQS